MAEIEPAQIEYQKIYDALLSKSNHLDLSNLGLQTIPNIIREVAPYLQSINLSWNKFREFPIDELMYLENLEIIDFSNNEISDLPSDISHLSNLRFLSFENNNLSSLPLEISNLDKIKYINLSQNKFIRFPSELCDLNLLESLLFNSNNTTSIPIEIGNLLNLKSLDISSNQIQKIPSEIGLLQNLNSLNASHNSLTDIPPEIGNIASLISLNLSENKLVSLPVEIRKLSNLKLLYLHGNSFLMPPEIIEKSESPEKIFDVIFSKSKVRLNECKILVVGEAGVGKTSLINKITGGNFDSKSKKTDGISINKLIEVDADGMETTLNIWDFGGQGIMQSTHQIFFTRRSIYVLVLDSRLTKEQNRLDHWIDAIQSRVDNSPILVVGNKIDESPLDIERSSLRQRYPNIVGIYETSAEKNIGINELKKAIIYQVGQLPHVHELIPENWLEVKKRLEKTSQGSSFITYDKYEEICLENSVHDSKEQFTVIEFLHQLGVVLYFQNNPNLESMGVLNPEWVTTGIYKILTSPLLLEKNGELSIPLLHAILKNEAYPHTKHRFIVEIMKEFKLSFFLPNKESFLLPDLLPKDQPIGIKFHGTPALEYKYSYLPPGIFTHLIVLMNSKIENEKVWRSGMVLTIGGVSALIKLNLDEKIITVEIGGYGFARRSALAYVVEQLDELHKSFPGLNLQMRVPVPDKPKVDALSYKFLHKLEEKGINEYPVPSGDELDYIYVQELLSGIEDGKQKTVPGNITINIAEHTKVGDIVIANEIQKSFNKTEATDAQAEFMKTLKQLLDVINATNNDLHEKQQILISSDVLAKLSEEAENPTPTKDKEWYKVSMDGLIEAAEKLDKLGTPVISLSRKILSLLTLGVIK